MLLEKINIENPNPFLKAYENNPLFVEKYFDYENKEASYKERMIELSERHFERDRLSGVIRSFMTPFGISKAAEKHINELKRKEAVTVVGGQQAGILTGPLYSVHKAITIILHAKEQREKLGVPVIPVFWVAGEDHDIDEINHTYTETNGRVTKEQMYERFIIKRMASKTKYDREKLAAFMQQIFSKFGETAHTEKLLQNVLYAVEMEDTFTSFFVHLMNHLFKEEGLLFIDAAYEPLRHLESDFFSQLIDESKNIAKYIAKTEETLSSEGFPKAIQADEHSANLFYIHKHGRMLLSRKNGLFTNADGQIELTKEEMHRIAKEQPALLSNNVVTRPIMQDFIFPVLAFVGGAGELAYWAILKEAFHHMSIKMPIFVPRMSMTIITRQSEKMLKEHGLTVADVMNGKAAERKAALAQSFQNEQFTTQVAQLERELHESFHRLSEHFFTDNRMMQQLIEQNLKKHQAQFDYLTRKYEELVYVQHENTLLTFDLLEAELFPLNNYQERIYNPYKYLNEYGSTLIRDMLALPFENDGGHYAIYL